MSNKKIAYFTNIAPHYRLSLWHILASETDFEFHFFFGRALSNSIKEISSKSEFWKNFKIRIHLIKNFRIRSTIIWQKGVIKETIGNNWDTYIFLGDMFIISTWIAAILAKLNKKTVVFWGHGIYGNEAHIKFFFRRSFLKLAHKQLLYNIHAKQQLIKAGFNESKLFVIYNSLDYNSHLKLRNELINYENLSLEKFFVNPHLPLLVFIGRLTHNKKLELLIESVKRLNAGNHIANLLIIGNGPALQNLINLSNELQGIIYFYGSCYEESEIGKLLFNASLCISPGSIGLTAIHSLSFGTPVVTHNNFLKQGPEFEIIEDNYNGAFFEENSIDSLTKVITNWLKAHPFKNDILRNICYKKIDMYYNPYYQLKIFKFALL